MGTNRYNDQIQKPVLNLKGFPEYYAEDAWLKMLRDYHPGKMVYEENPCIEVYRFRKNLYGLLDCERGSMEYTWMWVIMGEKKALLVDTGAGKGELRAIVEKITGGNMPLFVMNTHYSPESFGRNHQFESIYCHEYLAERLQNEQSQSVQETDRGNSEGICQKYKITAVPDGYRFDLGGGYEVELIEVPTEYYGDVVCLERQERFLIGGNVLGTGHIRVGDENDIARSAGIIDYKDGLTRLLEHFLEFDRIFCQYGIQDFDNRILYDLLDKCKQIIETPENLHVEEIEGRHVVRIKGGGYISFCENRR